MNGKTSKAKPKMADVTKPKKITIADPGSAPLIIQSRPIIGRASSISSSPDDDPSKTDISTQEETPSAPVLPSQSKRALIVPISDGLEKADTPAKETAVAPEEPKVETTADTPQAEAAAETAKEANPKVTPKPADAPAKEVKTTAEKTAEDTDDNTADEQANKKATKPSAETEKAVAEAAAAAKREHELESLIDSKQFYVPINAVARKREVKHSALMTIFVLLLAFVLIDLMLDSGLILLAERIPHTHFFTVSSIDQK